MIDVMYVILLSENNSNRRYPPVGRTAKTQQRTPLPATQKVGPKQPTFTEDDVRLRAYEIYIKRGENPGDDPGDEVSDWLQAERELQANKPNASIPGKATT